MKTTIAIAWLVLGFALGFAAHALTSSRPSTKHHWEVIDRYNAHVTNPLNYTNDPSAGLSATTPPGDLEPSLAVLVASGELSHADLVFPSVPYGREAARHWMKFAQNHKEIVYITGNPSYTALKPNGDQPLHLNIWFRDADQSVVQNLIKELEGTSQK
jgi:hypothetical protein